jgi:hypothetical protein
MIHSLHYEFVVVEEKGKDNKGGSPIIIGTRRGSIQSSSIPPTLYNLLVERGFCRTTNYTVPMQNDQWWLLRFGYSLYSIYNRVHLQGERVTVSQEGSDHSFTLLG